MKQNFINIPELQRNNFWAIFFAEDEDEHKMRFVMPHVEN